MHRALVLLLASWILLSLTARPAGAQAASYRDEEGRLHMVDRIEDVPARYREQANRGSAPRLVPEVGPVGETRHAPDAAPEPAPLGTAAAPASVPRGRGSSDCRLEFIEGPEKRLEGRRPKITYHGKVQNVGTGRARGIQVTLKVYRASDGRRLDEVTKQMVPGNLGPGEVGRFSVTADFEKLNNRNPGRDDLSVTMSRCEATAAEARSERSTRCKLEIPGGVKKKADGRRSRVVARGQVVNEGPGVARGVSLHWRTFDMESGALLDDHVVRVRPARLEPGEQGHFEHEISMDFGKRNHERDEFEAVAQRCSPP